HGDLAGSRVLLGEDGQPVLCGFDRAGLVGDDAEGDIRRGNDVAALVRLVVALLPGEPVSRAERRLRSRLRRCRSAAGVGSVLLDLVPGARLPALGAAAEASTAPEPGGDAVRPRARRWRRWRRWWWSATVLAAAIAAAVAVHAGHGPGSPSSEATGERCPSVDNGCGPLPRPGGLLAGPGGRYQLGRMGDVVVLGRWTCGVALPADLRPSSGQVWIFRAWPTGTGTQPGLLVRTVAGARSLRVRPGPGRCDQLVVARSGRPGLVVDPRAVAP
ncbi:MAG: hypothetical protein ACYC1D_14305, partial [Acidimicrobiales bacterium]